jgi:phosphodiesterase/alkaline phosphatase D-like protein
MLSNLNHFVLGNLLLVLVLLKSATTNGDNINLFAAVEYTPFELGVASGEPTENSVLIWTRAQTGGYDLFNTDQNITWSIWKSGLLPPTWIANGTILARKANDFTVMISVDGLEADTYYQYQFIHTESGNVSAIGNTRTAPLPTSEQHVIIATVSCSSIWSGYFNTYARIAETPNLNLVVHVGDFIYPEIDKSMCTRVPKGLDQTCASGCTGNQIDPANMTAMVARHNCSVSDKEKFRWVHQYYLHDPQLRQLRQAHPLVVLFDNHDLSSSRSVNLSSEAIQAFLEYIPLRVRTKAGDPTTGEFFRSYKFGSMVDLIALDTRAIGVNVAGDGTYLGHDQIQWLNATLKNSTSYQWRMILTTVAFAPWAVNGWDLYVNSIFAGVFVALLVLSACCASAFWLKRRRSLKTAELVEGKTENSAVSDDVIMPSSRRKRAGQVLKCCAIYGIISVLLLCIVWIVTTAIVNKVIVGRNLAVGASGNSLELVAGEQRNWDGNPADRRNFLQLLRDTDKTKNNVWVSGDL